MKISKAEKILLNFLDIKCGGDCGVCEFISFCDETCVYMTERGLYECGRAVYCDSDLEVEE